MKDSYFLIAQLDKTVATIKQAIVLIQKKTQALVQTLE